MSEEVAPKLQRQEDVDLTNESQERHPRVFCYAYFKADGEEGVHEDLLIDATATEGIKNAKKWWTDADEYKISYVQLDDPYNELFKK